MVQAVDEGTITADIDTQQEKQQPDKDSYDCIQVLKRVFAKEEADEDSHEHETYDYEHSG